MTLKNCSVLLDNCVVDSAEVVIRDGMITEIRDSLPEKKCRVAGHDNSTDLKGHRLVPGFVDIQVNGGGGVLFNNDLTVEALRTISNAHVQFGTTSLLPTLISDTFDVMCEGIDAVRSAIYEKVPGIIGIHLEGPFINPARRGAHDSTKIRAIDEEAIKVIQTAAESTIILVTLAPEQVGPEFVSRLTDAGVIVFAGHTAATYDECLLAEKHGLSGYTHLFNGMMPFLSRTPGAVGAALDSPRSVFTIIADCEHTHPTALRIACRAKYRGGAILVTDAMATVGSSSSSFLLYGEHISLVDGVLRNGAGSLAGSNLSMIDAVQNAVAFADVDWTEAARMAALYPARALNLDNYIGRIEVGRPADLVEIDDTLDVVRVWRGGKLEHAKNA
jgi:N-acetylglucosamine-6-phosphate deacetylase